MEEGVEEDKEVEGEEEVEGGGGGGEVGVGVAEEAVGRERPRWSQGYRTT